MSTKSNGLTVVTTYSALHTNRGSGVSNRCRSLCHRCCGLDVDGRLTGWRGTLRAPAEAVGSLSAVAALSSTVSSSRKATAGARRMDRKRAVLAEVDCGPLWQS